MAKLTRVTDMLITVKSKVANAITRLLEDKLMDSISVRDFGAKGDYNPTTGVGTDDTDSFQSCINFAASLGNRRNGGYPIIRIPSGNYLIDGYLTIPSAVGFGIEFVGDGWMTTSLRFNKNSANPAINIPIEYVHFTGIHFFGTYQDGDPDRKPIGIKCKSAWNAPDLDVMFRACAFSGFNACVQVHGRGAVIDECVASFSTHLLKVIADTDIQFTNGSESNSKYTGMRHYTVRNCRTDQCSRILTIEGDADCKDYINDVIILGNDMLSADKLIDAQDATIRRVVVSANTSLLSFATGVISARRIMKVAVSSNNFSKGYDDFSGDTKVIRSLMLCDEIVGATVTGNVMSLLSHNFIDMKKGSNITVANNVITNAWDEPEQSNHFVVYSTEDILGLTITGNTFQMGKGNGSYHLFNSAVQKNKRTYTSGNTANVNWTTECMDYSPTINADGTWISSGKYTVESGYCTFDFILSGSGVTTAEGEVIISLPIAAVPASQSISSYHSGSGYLSDLVGFSNTGSSVGQVKVETTGIKISRVNDLVATRLSYDKRNKDKILISGTVRYKV